MLNFKGKTFNVSDELIKQHGEYYDTPLAEWRIENYIRQRAKNKDDDITDIINSLSPETIIDFIEAGLKNEISPCITPADTIICQIHNPDLRARD